MAGLPSPFFTFSFHARQSWSSTNLRASSIGQKSSHYVFDVDDIINTTDTTFFFTFQKRVRLFSSSPISLLGLTEVATLFSIMAMTRVAQHHQRWIKSFSVVDFGTDLTLDQLHCFKISGRMVEDRIENEGQRGGLCCGGRRCRMSSLFCIVRCEIKEEEKKKKNVLSMCN
ncbi:uncharacterized protein HKW66_Vig0220950 [Vigna angularis]|uniref:Uncharacterized protein n=1 Tax=Phaseolus angularis TaxID=3914 RepID=A0A8T0K1A8_PHAAN|nr:uncharacterized protein HKW66_Vig0220950 [Vigna angularis]